MITAHEKQIEHRNKRYRDGYDRIAFPSRPVTVVRTAQDRLISACLGEVVDLEPENWAGYQAVKHMRNGEICINFTPKFVPENTIY